MVPTSSGGTNPPRPPAPATPVTEPTRLAGADCANVAPLPAPRAAVMLRKAEHADRESAPRRREPHVDERHPDRENGAADTEEVAVDQHLATTRTAPAGR